MRVFFKRKLIKIGDSVGIVIPADIVRTYDLEAGNAITFIADTYYEPDGVIALDIMGRQGTELHKYLDG